MVSLPVKSAGASLQRAEGSHLIQAQAENCTVFAHRTGTSFGAMRFHAMTNASKTRHDDKSPPQDEKISPAGTHDKPELTDRHKTPGSGMLPDKDNGAVEGPTG